MKTVNSINRYEQDIQWYADHYKLPRNASFVVFDLEHVLYNIIWLGIETTNDPDIVFAYAVYVVELRSAQMNQGKTELNTQDITRIRHEVSNKVAHWMHNRYKKGVWIFKRSIRTEEEYYNQFKRLALMFPMK